MKRLKALGVVLAIQMLIPAQMMLAWTPNNRGAEGVSPGSAESNSAGQAGQQVPLNLDLASTEASVAASLANSVNVNVGGAMKTINPGDLVTPAEFVAAYQVMNGGNQRLHLGADGNAIAGRMSLTGLGQIGDLVVPASVRVLQDFSSSQLVNLAGNLTNAGKFVAFSNSPAVNAGELAANNITNSGTVASYLASFTMSALGNLVNTGTVTGAGNLTMSAGGTLTNTGLVSAGGDLNMLTANVVNAGMLQSLNGNINLNTVTASNIIVNNIGGTFEALKGAINVRELASKDMKDLTMVGGSYLSKELNLNSCGGTVELRTDDLTGQLNIKAAVAHTFSSTDTLTLGNLDLSGDPTFYNLGDININGPISVGQDLAIVAEGNITATSATAKLVANDGALNGSNILVIAGADIDTTNCMSCTTTGQSGFDNPMPDQVGVGESIDVDLTAGPGGNINFSASTEAIVIDSSAIAAGGMGGDVILVAHANGATGGRVTMPGGGAVNANGLGAGANGNVRIFAGANTGTGITLGSVNANAGSGGGGTATIFTTQAVTNDALPLTLDEFGQISSGNLVVPGAMTNSNIVRASGTLTANEVQLASGSGAIGSAGSRIAIDAPNMNVNTTGNVFLSSTRAAGVSINAPSTAANFQMISSGTMSVDGTLTATGVLTMQTLAGSNGSINVNAGVSGANGVTMTTDGTGSVAVAAATAIMTTNSALTLIANDVQLNATGTLVAGSGTVTLRPNGNKAISVGTGATGFGVSQTEMNNITAGTLAIGSTGNTGGLTIDGAVNVSSLYSLTLNNGGVYTATGQTVTIGGNDLTVTTTGNADNFTGAVTGTGGSLVTFLTVGGLLVDGAVDANTSSNVTMTSTAGGIGLSADVTGDVVTMSAHDNIRKLAPATINAPISLSLTSTHGNIGPAGFTLDTNTPNLTYSSFGHVIIFNAQALDVQQSSATVTQIEADGMLNVLGTLTGTDVVLSTKSGSNGSIDLAADINAPGGVVELNADGAGEIIQSSGSINAGAAGSLNMNAGGNVGSSTNPIEATAGNITVLGADVFIDVTGSTELFTANASNNLTLTATGSLTLGGFAVQAGLDLNLTAAGITTENGAVLSGNNVTLSTTSNGNIEIGDDINGFSTIVISANGSGEIDQVAGSLNTLALSLSSGSADIIGIDTNATTIQANTTGNVVLTASGPVTLLASTGNGFSLMAAGNLTVNALLNATGDVNLETTAGNGTIQLNANINGGNIALTADGSGSILMANTSLRLNAPTGAVDLASGTGDIGTLAIPIQVDASSVSGSTSAPGSVHINSHHTGPVDLGPASGFDFVFTAANTINVVGFLNFTHDVSVSNTDGDINLGASVTGTHQVTLIADDQIARTAGVVTGLNVTLTAVTIGADLPGERVVTQAGSLAGEGLTITAFLGNAYVDNQGGVRLLNSTAINQFFLRTTAAGNLIVDNGMSADEIRLTTFATGGGNIVMGAGIISGTASAELHADGSIDNTAGGSVTANNINLTATDGSIGAGGNQVNTNAGDGMGEGLEVHAPAGSANIYEADGLNIKASNTLSNFWLDTQAAGDINVVGDVSGNDVEFQTFFGGGSSINLSANINGGSVVCLCADQNITRTAGVVTGDYIELNANNGSIGGVGAEVYTNAGSGMGEGLLIDAFAGSAYIKEADAARLQFGQVDAAGTMSVETLAAGNLIIDTGLSGGNITLVTFAGGGGDIVMGSSSITGPGATVLTMTADGSIDNAAGGDLNFNKIDLTATTGSIGALGNEVKADSSSGPGFGITLNAPLGSAYLTEESGGGQLNLSSVQDDLFWTATAAGNLIVAATVSGDDVRITTFVSGAGSINLDASINGGTQVVLNADGSIIRTLGVVTGDTVSLTATTGDIGGILPGDNVFTNAGTGVGKGLDMHALAGSAYVTDSDGLGLNASSVLNDMYISTTAIGNVVVQGALSADEVRITPFAGPDGGGIQLQNTINAVTNVFLSSRGSISNLIGVASLITAPQIELTSTFGLIGEGDPGHEIYTNAGTVTGLTVSAPLGTAVIMEADAVKLNASSVNATLRLQTLAAGNIDVAGALGGEFVTLITFATGGGNINLADDITAGTSISLTADGSITRSAGTLSAIEIGLSATTGNVGANVAGQQIFTNAGAFLGGLTVNALLGSAYIQEADAVKILGALTDTGATGELYLDTLAAGDITVAGFVFGKDVRLTTFAGPGSKIILGANTWGSQQLHLTAHNSIEQTAGTAESTIVVLTSTTGSIGTTTPDTPILINAGDVFGEGLTATALSGTINLKDSDNIRVNSVTAGGDFKLQANGFVNSVGVISSGDDTTILTTNNGAVTLNDNLMSTNGVLIVTHGTGNFTLAATKQLSNTNAPLQIDANDVIIDGTITNGVFQVVLRPNGDGKSIEVAGAGGGTFNLSSAELANITAGQLIVGNQNFGGGFTVAGAVDVSVGTPGTDPGVFNLDFRNAGAYTANGQTITLGARELLVGAGGTVDTGEVVATTGNISFTAGDDLTVSADVTTGGVGTVLIKTDVNPGDIILNGDVGGGTTTTIDAFGTGNVSQLAGKTVTGTTVNMYGDTGVIGLNQSIDIDAANLQAFNGGDVFLHNVGVSGITINAASGGSEFELTSESGIMVTANLQVTDTLILQTNANDGAITLSAAIVSGTNGVTLTTNGLGNVTVSNGTTLSSTNSAIVVTANDVEIQATGFVNAGNGQATLQPNSANTIEVAGTGLAAFNVSTAEMANITAGTLQVGTTAQAGAFTVAGDIDVSGAGPAGVYNLVFQTGGLYTATGTTITLGAHNLEVEAGGTVDTGAVTSGAGGDIKFTAGGLLTTTGDLSTTDDGHTLLKTSLGSGASIVLNHDIGGGEDTTVDADGGGTITQAALKVVTGTNVALLSGSGTIGTDASNRIRTNAVNLTVFVTNTGSAYVHNLNYVNLDTSKAADLYISADGSITTFDTLTGTNVVLETLVGNGPITLGAVISAIGLVSLTTHGSGEIDGNGHVISANTLSLNSTSGNIGTALDPIKTNADFVNASTSGQVHVEIIGATQIGPASGSVLSFSASDDITTGGTITATDTLTIKTTANDGSITISNSASGVNGVTIQTNGAGNFIVDGGATVSSSAASIQVEANDVDLAAGFLNADENVVLFPNGSKSISLGGAGGTFTVLQADLNVITANIVEIGSASVGGNMTLAGSINVSSLDYVLSLRNAGTYTGTGQTITAGTKSVSVSTAGAITSGNVTSTSGNIFVISDTSISVNGNLSTGGSGQVSVQTTAVSTGDIALGGNVGGGAMTDVSIYGSGNITRTSGSVSGTMVSFTAEGGSIGASTITNRVATQTANLNANSEGGDVYVINTGDVALLSASAGDGKTFSLTAQSGIDIQSNIEAQNMGDVIGTIFLSASGSDPITNTGANTLVANNVSLNTVNGDIGASGSEILTDTDSLTLSSTGGGVFLINDGSLTLQSSTIGGNLELTTTGGGITTGGAINAANVTFIGNSLVNANTITATGGSTFAMTGATGLTVSGGGTVTAAGGISFTATNGTLSFTGSQLLNGTATLNGQGTNGVVSVNAGESVHAFNDMIINACQINNPPPGFTANGVVFFNFTCCTGGGTIANSEGDVILSSNLVIVGSAVAIIASGSVIAEPGFTMIDLSSSTGQGGNLNIIAGFDFTPATLGQVTDTTTTFSLGSPSATGGSVFLDGVNINTSSTSAGFAAGSVTILAHAGSEADGTVTVGDINASANGNPGGTVIVTGQGGVSAGDILASGSQGGTVSLGGAEPVFILGPVTYTNGMKGGTGVFGFVVPSSGANAPVQVGAINTTGLQGNGGGVFIDSDTSITVAGSIIASGGTSGGNGGLVDIQTADGRVTVAGDIIALGGSTSSAMAAGNGGNLTFNVPAFASVSGNVLLSGGNNSGSGAGGVGGDFTAVTDLNTLGTTPRSFRIGTIGVFGYVDQQGGDSTSGNGGAGGFFTVDAGALTISGFNGGVSLNTSAGTGGTPGANGDVSISTYSLQQLPVNFMLTSINLSEIALAGGMFNVGNGTVNGTAGTIVSGANVATSANAGRILNTNPFALGGIEIDVTGPSSYTINLGGTPTVISVDAGAGTPRTQVTPGMALALYQVSRDSSANAQTIGLERKGKVTDKNPVTGLSPSVITINTQELPTQFTAFVLNTQGNKPGLTVNMQGAASTINVANPGQGAATNFFYINGDLIFTTANSNVLMNIAGNTFNMSKDGSFVQNGTSSAALITGNQKQWTAQGTITSGSIGFESSTNMTFDMGTSGTINGTGVGSDTRFIAAGGNLQVKGGLKAGSLVNTELGEAVATGTMSWTANGTLNIADGAVIQSNGAMTITPGQNTSMLTFGDNATIGSGSTLTAKASSVTVGEGVFMSALGALSLTASDNAGTMTIGNGATVRAGFLSNSAPPTGVLVASDILSVGSVYIAAGKQTGVLTVNSTLVDPTTITSNGADVSLISGKTGNLVMGNNLSVNANGGNIYAFGGGTVTGGTGVSFTARAVGNLTSFTGGGVEIGAGLTSNGTQLVSTLKNRPATFTQIPTPFPSIGTFNLVPASPTRGVLQANIKNPGVINIGTGVNPATFTVNGGVIIFDAKGQNVTITGPQIRVDAPVAFRSDVELQGEMVVDTGDDCDVEIEDGTVSILP